MKKILSILLILAICFSSFVTFAEDAEYKAGDEYKDQELINSDTVKKEEDVLLSASTGIYYSDMTDMTKVGILGALDIMGAYSGNEFKPNVLISRIECLKSAMNLVDIDYTNVPTINNGLFYDVEEGSDAYNAVYTAYNLGIIRGYPTNTFKPDGVMSYDDALIMVIHALGYGKNTMNAAGGYTKGYRDIAQRLGLDDGIKVYNPKAITRYEFAQILYNALEAPIAEFSIDDSKVNISGDGESVLSYYYDVFHNYGVVTANSICDLEGNLTERGSIYIDNKKYKDKNEFYNELLGYSVEYWYNTKTDEVVYAVKDSGVVEKYIYAKDYIDFKSSKIYYEENNREKVANVNPIYTLIYNGTVPKDNYNESIFDIDTGYIKLVSNNASSKYDLVVIEEYENYAIERASLDSNELNIPVVDGGRITIDLDETKAIVYDANGAYSEVVRYTDKGDKKYDISAIEKNSVLSLVVPYNGYVVTGNTKLPKEKISFVKIYVSTNTVTGSVSEFNQQDNSVIITNEANEQKEYKISLSNAFKDIKNDLALGTKATFLIDKYGEIAGKKTSSDDFTYAYIIEPIYSEKDNTIESLKLLTYGGLIEIMPIKYPVKVNSKSTKDKELAGVLTTSAKLLKNTFEYSQPIKYKVTETEEGKKTISQIQTVTQSVGLAEGFGEDHIHRMEANATYRSESGNHGILCDVTDTWKGKYFNPAKVFKVPTSETGDDESYRVSSISTGITYSAIALDVFDADDLQPKLVVWYSNDSSDERIPTSFQGSDAPVMFNDSYLASNDNGDTILKISVAQMGTVKEYWSYDLELVKNVVPGQLLWIYGSNETNELTKIEDVLYNGKRIRPDELPKIETAVHTNDEYYNDFVEAYEVIGTREMSLQRGNYIVNPDGSVDDRRRETFITGYFASDAWMMGGVLVYEKNGKEITVRNGSIDDVRSVMEYGSEKASKIIARVFAGAARQYVIYNFD